jgi:menaquinone-dependent protoporphyrinogen IX oxidase
MMKVLVTAASKHGATGEIAQAIGDALRDQGLDATVLESEHVDAVDAYDAVVLGSAVYAGHWLKPARKLVARCGSGLAVRPAIVSALRVPEGDFRDWAGISGWAVGIATALRSRSPATPGRAGHAHQ